MATMKIKKSSEQNDISRVTFHIVQKLARSLIQRERIAIRGITMDKSGKKSYIVDSKNGKYQFDDVGFICMDFKAPLKPVLFDKDEVTTQKEDSMRIHVFVYHEDEFGAIIKGMHAVEEEMLLSSFKTHIIRCYPKLKEKIEKII